MFSASLVRQKWKSLRDKFRTTLASIPKPKSGDASVTDYQGTWKYFSSLLFLKDQFTPRKSGGNFDDKDDCDTILEDTCLPQDQYDDNDENQESASMQEDMGSSHHGSHSTVSDNTPSSSRPSSSADKHRKTKQSSKENLGDALLQVEKEKLQYLQNKKIRNDEYDEDLNFFRSLLPHVRTLSAYDKMEYRMRVIKITQEFLRPTQSIIPATRNIDSSSYTQNSFISETVTARNYYDNAESHLNILPPSGTDSFQSF